MIIVKDDFFKVDLANLIAKGTETYQWSYNHKSDVNDPAHNKFFVSHLWTDSSEDNFFHMLWKLIKEVQSVQDCDCWRIIANGQIKGQNGNWHTDHGEKLFSIILLAGTLSGVVQLTLKLVIEKRKYNTNKTGS